MIALSDEASAQVEALERFYLEKKRPAALRNLGQSLSDAALLISTAPELGLVAPRPYPQLARLGWLWVKRGRYWIAYQATPAVIVGVFVETDDIPNRV